MVTVAVVGAGIAGLVCGQALRAAGHQVVWLEKSRGVGGRMATRRLVDGLWADHGLRYWPRQASSAMPIDLDSDMSPLASLVQCTEQLLPQGLLHRWMASGFRWQGQLIATAESRYCAEGGINAIAKHIAQHADIRRQQRVVALGTTAAGWQLSIQSPEHTSRQLQAEAVVLAMPAPQVAALIGPLDPSATTRLDTVAYAPCLSLMVTYPELPQHPELDPHQGWYIDCEHPTITWLSLESSKPQHQSQQAAFQAVVIQSQPAIATHYFEQVDRRCDHPAALEELKTQTILQLLSAAAEIVPGLDHPQSQRLQGWRYSQVRQPLPVSVLSTTWPSLVACGDWCNPTDSGQLAAAYQSGLAAAHHIQLAIASS